jgi:hypothetical protein
MKLITLITLAAFALGLATSHAAEIIPLKIKLAPNTSKEIVVTLSGSNLHQTLTLADVEKLPLQQTTLITPWGTQGTFQGVMLKDLLSAYHLTINKRVIFKALDNYVAGISKGEIERSPAFIATRFNGLAIPLNNKGPLILLWPARDTLAAQNQAPQSSWTWSISEINVE